MTLEERITRLEDIEAIRYLQAKYQRCLDTREFDELASCFADDVVSDYGNGTMAYEGKDAVIKFLCSVMTLDMPSSHLIHGGEIDIIDANTAKAKWYLEDFLLHEKYKMKIHGAAIYEVEYKKLEDKWLITKIGYKRQYEFYEGMSILNRLTLKKKTFLDAKKNESVEGLGEYNKYFHENRNQKKSKKK